MNFLLFICICGKPIILCFFVLSHRIKKDDNLIINGINTYCITKPPYSFHPLHEVQGRHAYLLIS